MLKGSAEGADISNIREVTINGKYWFNLSVTIGVLALMFQGDLTGSFIFMIGLALVLLGNFPKTKDQFKVVKDSAEYALYI